MSDHNINWDFLGITTSVACAIHCAILPLIITSLPVFGINIIENISFEYLMIFITAVIGSIALLHGYRFHHHRLLPLSVFTLGILFLVAKQIWHSWQFYLLTPAVFLISCAHLYNYLLNRKSGHATDF